MWSVQCLVHCSLSPVSLLPLGILHMSLLKSCQKFYSTINTVIVYNRSTILFSTLHIVRCKAGVGTVGREEKSKDVSEQFESRRVGRCVLQKFKVRVCATRVSMDSAQ